MAWYFLKKVAKNGARIASEDDQYMARKIAAQCLPGIENITKLKMCTRNIA